MTRPASARVENRGASSRATSPAPERLPAGTAEVDLPAHPTVRAELARLLAAQAATATGSSNRVVRALVLTEPLSFDRGEVTDKGSVNQRAVLRNRADLADALYSDDPRVITTDEAVQG